MRYSEAFHSHNGKYSDKWSQYLGVYDLVLADISNPKNILEIGVQNGGSLEIWSELYPDAENILGVDIDKKCSELVFQDGRINVIVADAKTEAAFNEITKTASSFDVIVDDGSHTSEDIIKTFIKLLPTLKPGGIYLIEDLHASYWPSFGGSLFGTETAVSYIKRVVDLLNFHYWSQDHKIEQVLDYSDIELPSDFISAARRIVEVRFFDSIAVIRLATSSSSKGLQTRVSSGEEAIVNPEPKRLVGMELKTESSGRNAISNHGRITSDEYLKTKRELDSVLDSRSWRWTELLRKLARLLKRT